MPRVFISYVRENSEVVRRLVHALKAGGVDVWFDQTHLKPGDRWADVIRREIAQGDFFLACFSAEYSKRPKSFMNEEITQAIDQIRQRPTDQPWFIPVLLSKCKVPDRSISAWETIRSFQWVALYEDWSGGILSIFSVVQPTLTFEPETILIPAGVFLMGSNPKTDGSAYDSEKPQHPLYLPRYYLAKTPVTNAQYAIFVGATGHRQPEGWTEGTPLPGRADYPVVAVSWHDAVAYCRWLSEITGKSFSLPSEAEWEKGARGTVGHIYPWGNVSDARRCNSLEDGPGGPTSVGSYPEGKSPYGILDMAGNVWEWTRSLRDFPYPYNPNDGREDLEAPDNMPRVLRGGSFFDPLRVVRCASRYKFLPRSRDGTLGFRIVMLP